MRVNDTVLNMVIAYCTLSAIFNILNDINYVDKERHENNHVFHYYVSGVVFSCECE